MAINSESLLKDGFIEHVQSFRQYLCLVKERLDKYDRDLKDEPAKIAALKEQEAEIFRTLDNQFSKLWDFFRSIDRELFAPHKQYCEAQLLPYLYENVEINEYVRKKPLGYAGDYVTMNYIYDYHDGKYLGKTLYAKLVNHYTCNTPVSRSNIYRKQFLKEKILETTSEGEQKTILSVGCGPARELVELLRERKIKAPATFHLLDLEKNAIRFVQKELETIPYDNNMIKIHFHLLDLIAIAKNRKIKEIFNGVDLVYVSGVFDYLSDRIATRVLKSLFEVTKKELIVFNMSLENSTHRAYYEILGEWVMHHRRKETLLAWCKGISPNAKANIVNYPNCTSYWILQLSRT